MSHRKRFQRLDALLDPAIDRAPVGGCDHARDDVEWQNAVDRGPVAIDGESNSKGEQLALGIRRPLTELLQFELLKAMPKRGQMTITVLWRAYQLAVPWSWAVIVERSHRRRIFQSCNRRHAAPCSASALHRRGPDVEIVSQYKEKTNTATYCAGT